MNEVCYPPGSESVGSAGKITARSSLSFVLGLLTIHTENTIKINCLIQLVPRNADVKVNLGHGMPTRDEEDPVMRMPNVEALKKGIFWSDASFK